MTISDNMMFVLCLQLGLSLSVGKEGITITSLEETLNGYTVKGVWSTQNTTDLHKLDHIKFECEI